MHVLGASRSLPFHGIGGMQAIAWDVFRTLAQQGHRVTVLTTAVEGRPARFRCDGVDVVALAEAPAEKYSRAWWSESDAVAAAIHRDEPVDAVLSISAAAAGMRRLRRAAPDVRFVMQAHGTSWGELQSKWRSRQLLQRLKSVKNVYWLLKERSVYDFFDEVVVVGDVLKKQFERWPMTWTAGSVPKRLIRNGIDTQRFRPDPSSGVEARVALGIPQDVPVIVFVSRLHPQKGGQQLIDAFERLAARDPQPHLLLVGGGEDERALRARAQAAAAAQRIHFSGEVKRDAIPGLLASARIFAFPTLRQEGLPMNVLEALACGLHVAASESMQDVFPTGRGLRYADPNDTERFADAMAQALADAVRSPPASLLTDDYSLTRCVDAYVECLLPHTSHSRRA